VLVCNHVSFVDALVIMAASPRPIRFVMDHRIFRTPCWLRLPPLRRHSHRLGQGRPGDDGSAFAEVSAALAAGDLVGIFPEGKITDGELQPFRPGITRILPPTRCRSCRWRCPGCGAASSRARTAGDATFVYHGLLVVMPNTVQSIDLMGNFEIIAT
jgi:hypothetical protein